MQVAPVFEMMVATFALAIAFVDVRERRIPNALVFPAILFGVIYHLILPIDGRLLGLKGLVTGFLLLLLPYASGGMKAGDVKFLMAIGALIGWQSTVNTLLSGLTLYPLFALFFVLREKKLLLTWLRFKVLVLNLIGFVHPGLKLYAMRLEQRDDPEVESVRTPFGLSLAAGVIVVLVTGGNWPLRLST